MLPKKPHDKDKSILDPFVVVDIAGHKADKQSQRSPVIQNNGWSSLIQEIDCLQSVFLFTAE